MAQHTISYNPSADAVGATSVAMTSGVEKDLTIITDTKYMQKSLFSVYLKLTLGTATAVVLKYYVSPNGGTDWYQIPVLNASSHLDGLNETWDATSPALIVRDIKVSAATAFKVTGTATAGTATGTIVRILARDN